MNSKTILVIEDHEEIRENMAEILELSGYTVIAAANGKEGVEQAIQHKPDLIVCDIMMPVLDGYGVIHMLQKNERTQSIPFIFLTAMAEKSEVRKGMDLGADDYIMKPFNGTELLSAIESRLRKAALVNTKISAGLEGLDSLTAAAGGKAIVEMANDRSTLVVKKKQVVYTEGSRPHHLYFVKRGKVKIYQSNDDGKELVTGLYNEGDFLGYTALLAGTIYKDTAEALEETEVAVIPRKDFEFLVHNNSEVMMQFIKLLANNVAMREHQLLSLAYNSLRKKVADALMAIYNTYGGGNTGFVIDIGRENLANIAGTAKESVIRTLGDFKDEQLIDIRQGGIIILDSKKLQALMN